MKLIVGLGNPGEKYAANRHNIGFMAVDEIARGYNFSPWKKRFQGLTAEGQIGLEKCILVKPSTYMNESGRAVGEAMRFYKIAIGDVIVIHDEIDLPPGKVRVKTGGGNAGHNGLKSISAHVGNEYLRVRLGVGHPGDRALVADYVLRDFAKSDREWLDKLLIGIARGMARLVEGGEAPFLSEAARGFAKLPQAAKANGDARRTAPASPEVTQVVKSLELAGIEAILAAASRPIAAMAPPPPPTPMPVAAREGSAAAVTIPPVVAEPENIEITPAAELFEERIQEPVEETEARPAEAPHPEPIIQEAMPEKEPEAVFVEPIAANEWVPPASVDEKQPEPEPLVLPQKQPEKASGLGSWFRSRLRGSAG